QRGYEIGTSKAHTLHGAGCRTPASARKQQEMSERVRIAIIGAGKVADFHHVPAIRIDPRAELAAICDPDESLLAQRKDEWKVPKATTDYEQIASDRGIDAVIVCTPNFTHLPITLACVEAGKHVMCEKPLGVSYGEAKQMYEAARDKGGRHMTAFTYRVAPGMRYVSHLVKAGALGTPRHFRSQRFLDWPETS